MTPSTRLRRPSGSDMKLFSLARTIRAGNGGAYPSPPDEKSEYGRRTDWKDRTHSTGNTTDPQLFDELLMKKRPSHDFPLFPASGEEKQSSKQVLHTNRTIIDLFNRNAAEYLMRNCEELKRYPGAYAHLGKRARVDVPETAPPPMKKRRVVNRSSPPKLISPRPTHRISKGKSLAASEKSEATPAPAAPRIPKPPGNRDDSDYHSIPDFCPPLSTLTGPRVLKVDWKGGVLDLSNDPDRHLLHEAESNVAATLRLTCAVYLCSKRRIFQARLNALRVNKEFRKTDAQQACKIDVNKASKLWTAFEKVGWFDPQFMQQYL